ncbi:MAG: ABC transporter substrate-binding protein, partial [Candidatus Tectomicrobia bacterium]|nr:ABC transporter substrate-binding protein [Candidatus Tectomicrobia bacterium]
MTGPQTPVSRAAGMPRRRFLHTLGLASGSVMLAGLPTLQAQSSGSAPFQLKAPEANPKYGGTLRYGILSAPAHFDVHQSGTVANMAGQGPMYDNLVRRHPLDGQTIIPDLAHSWEVTPDSKTYTFFLRQGVQFHDGAEFTADDVHATFSRIIFPPKGFSSPRTPLFSAVEAINVRDRHTIEFKLREPRPQDFMLGAFASGWNIIVRKKTLEDNNYNLRTVESFPGTGPFKHVKRVDKEVWIMEKNPHYWNKGLPYLDRVEIYHLAPWSPEVAASLLGGKLDYARTVDPVAARKIQTMSNFKFVDFYQSVIHAIWVNNAKPQFADPRVRRAMHLALDRHALVEVVKDVTPTLVGGFTYPFSEFAASKEEQAKLLGYQPDPTAALKEARALMAAAGHEKGLKGLDFMVRELPHHKLWSVAIQAMLKEALGIESTMRPVQTSVWFDEAQSGNFDITISAIVSTLLDPTDYF